jgi:glycosyltransferase involved in cell wall biosynthesis
MKISVAMKYKEKSAIRAAPSPKHIAVFYDRINFLTLGTLVGLTKSYVDKVYVLENGDSRVEMLARSLGAEVIDKNDGARPWETTGHEDGYSVLVALYGDGTHDPCCIPRLIAPVQNGRDIALGVKNKQTMPSGSGFIACSASYCSGEDSFDRLINKARSSSGHRLEYVYLDDDPEAGSLSRHRVGVVVPAYNEELLLAETIRSIPPYIEKYYVIDDGSTDGTKEALNKIVDSRMVSVRHPKNMGVGAAIISGYKLALVDGMDIIAVMAGDNQMDPAELPRLLRPIIDGRADYTKGNRLVNKEFRKGMSRWRSFGNFLLTLITKIGSGYWHISDPQNGYTAISRKALEMLNLDSVYTYYGYCNDLLIKLNVIGIRVMDVAIPARYGNEKSSIKYSKFILKVAPMIFRGFLWRLKMKYVIQDFHPLVFFYGLGMIMVPAGLIFSVWTLAEKLSQSPIPPDYPVMAGLITIMGLQFLLFAMLFDKQAGSNCGALDTNYGR